MSEYCPECGGSHPTLTVCPYKKKDYHIPEVGPSMFENPIVKKLSRIIELLERMEQYLRTMR